ncbi:hypothetical protein [Nocardioides sp. NPDC006273]|uniref:hypothetical protein n=1 Tax=Actinomycetes TaxID=1760 RepID=UPI00339DEDB1
MNHRQDIVDMLLAGHSQRAVMRTLGVGWPTVQAARKALGLTPTKPGNRPETVEVTFARRTKATAEGHLLWVGSDLNIRVHGRYGSVRRWVFERKYRRPPVGNVTTTCEVPRCVHPDHLEDARQRAQYTAIFG